MTPLDPLLLAALLDPKNETDDGLRMACADFFEEHDEPERAEFIRVQMKTQWPIGVLDSWRRRERELLGAHHLSWDLFWPGALWPIFNPEAQTFTGPAPWSWEYRRGFIHSITCTAADWLAHADAILAAQPVREVQLTTWPEHDWTGGRDARLKGFPFRPLNPWPGTLHTDWPVFRQRIVQSLLATEWPHVRFTLPSPLPAAPWEMTWPSAGATLPPLRLSPLEEGAGATGGYTVPPEFVEPLQQAIPSSRDARRQRKQRQARTHARK